MTTGDYLNPCLEVCLYTCLLSFYLCWELCRPRRWPGYFGASSAKHPRKNSESHEACGKVLHGLSESLRKPVQVDCWAWFLCIQQQPQLQICFRKQAFINCHLCVGPAFSDMAATKKKGTASNFFHGLGAVLSSLMLPTGKEACALVWRLCQQF